MSPYEIENAIQKHFNEIVAIVVFERESKLNAMVQLNRDTSLKEEAVLNFVKCNGIYLSASSNAS